MFRWNLEEIYSTKGTSLTVDPMLKELGLLGTGKAADDIKRRVYCAGENRASSTRRSQWTQKA